MGFLDYNFDLQRTPFTQRDLDYARHYWQRLIEKVAPGWLEDLKGGLAVHWQSDTIPSVVRLIDLARMLYTLMKAITEESNPIFGSKLHQLLFSDGIQHGEQVTELMVGALLGGLGTPIEMEPICATAATGKAIPGTVDYSIKWGDNTRVFIESTFFHIQRLLDWESAIDDLRRRFARLMERQNINRALRIMAPLELTHKTLSPQAINEALRLVTTTGYGSHSLRLDRHQLVLDWSPVPHLEAIPKERPAPMRGGFVIAAGAGIKLGMVAASQVTLRWPDDAEELVHRSLRNTLDRKRIQFQMKSPYVLFMRISNQNIPGVLDILGRRVYNNKRYRWISAICVLKVSFGQRRAYRPQVTPLTNPNANYPLPESLTSALAGLG